VATGPAKHLSLPKKILFSVITVSLLFTIIEGGLRISGFRLESQYSIFSEKKWLTHGVGQDPTLPWSWIPIPGAVCIIDRELSFRFNALGTRGPLFQKEKVPDSLRIICMGDSGTMGWGVKDGEMYCSGIQEILERRCERSVETINAGVFGYTSFQGLHQLKNRIVELHPDIITICYNWNDHAPAIRISNGSQSTESEKGIPAPDKALHTPRSYSGFLRLVSSLRIFQLMQYGALKTRELFPDPGNEQNSASGLLRVALEDYKNNLENMITLARDNKITPILLTQAFNPKSAMRPNLHAQYKKQQQYNDAIREVASTMNVACVDPTTVLETDARFFNSNTHPTKPGHRKIAMLLADAIVSKCN